MCTLQETQEYNRKRREIDSQVVAGLRKAPPCFTCKAPSTHVTDSITPAGYRAYQCDIHTPTQPKPLWGSDPGWQSHYIPLPRLAEVQDGN